MTGGIVVDMGTATMVTVVSTGLVMVGPTGPGGGAVETRSVVVGATVLGVVLVDGTARVMVGRGRAAMDVAVVRLGDEVVEALGAAGDVVEPVLAGGSVGVVGASWVTGTVGGASDGGFSVSGVLVTPATVGTTEAIVVSAATS